MRSALRGTEVIPPADGWARLERELGLTRVSPCCVAIGRGLLPLPPLC